MKVETRGRGREREICFRVCLKVRGVWMIFRVCEEESVHAGEKSRRAQKERQGERARRRGREGEIDTKRESARES